MKNEITLTLVVMSVVEHFEAAPTRSFGMEFCVGDGDKEHEAEADEEAHDHHDVAELDLQVGV